MLRAHRSFTFRASPVLLDKIEALAAARGQSRSAAVKAAVVAAEVAESGRAPVPDHHEVLALLGEAARGGSVPAMKELLAHHRDAHRRDRARPDSDTVFGELDEVAMRRQRGGSGPLARTSPSPVRTAARTVRIAATPVFGGSG